MNVRAQISSVFHLDKCIGCHTCSVACKNQWTDRKGVEYAWWNNVETRPGTGYPVLWEDQERHQGGWKVEGGELSLRQASPGASLGRLFHNPNLPVLQDYYEPWTYKYDDLFTAPAGDVQPTARPVSLVDGKPIDIASGPAWDDDLGGSGTYAANDPGLAALTEAERTQLFDLERMVFFYLPRICNHCLNAACVAACPSGAIYKRGEDGVVLISQDVCKGWRMCVSACPYKKVYFNWETGKSEKCILCYPRLEAGEAPACFHTCVGRIRYLGVLLYDADRIAQAASRPDQDLVAAQRSLILDPSDPAVIAAARASGVPDAMVESARRSPVYRFVKEWEIALPLHPEYRTLPMLFYVPPLLPALARSASDPDGRFFTSLESARLPLRYLAGLFGGGNEAVVEAAYRRLIAVRVHRRAGQVGDVTPAQANAALEAAGLHAAQADEIHRMTTLAPMEERIVIPPMAREADTEPAVEPQPRSSSGLGFLRPLGR
ncbi:nitrate reductase, beta subunit [Anaeromyxobacter sp. K]|uniref:nitrate reductase subunit beta n=1 Tax=Anaeromyxobacter sp. (strain K) TaxID=447217 RepID=UPI00015F8B28|nr:nitrate reductase subunit beta [Anaeromyxobacter sp. K]ACG72936.1 nitrate reductase, beta subunit [Anaeromyxobacter sp. K]